MNRILRQASGLKDIIRKQLLTSTAEGHGTCRACNGVVTPRTTVVFVVSASTGPGRPKKLIQAYACCGGCAGQMEACLNETSGELNKNLESMNDEARYTIDVVDGRKERWDEDN
jgi:hypothetical protein